MERVFEIPFKELTPSLTFFFFFSFYLFSGPCWVFVAAPRLSLVVVSGGYSLVEVSGFSLRWLLSLQSTDPAAAAKSLQLCPTLCDRIDGSPPVSPIPEILHARTLEWVAISFSNA